MSKFSRIKEQAKAAREAKLAANREYKAAKALGKNIKPEGIFDASKYGSCIMFPSNYRPK